MGSLSLNSVHWFHCCPLQDNGSIVLFCLTLGSLSFYRSQWFFVHCSIVFASGFSPFIVSDQWSLLWLTSGFNGFFPLFLLSGLFFPHCTFPHCPSFSLSIGSLFIEVFIVPPLQLFFIVFLFRWLVSFIYKSPPFPWWDPHSPPVVSGLSLHFCLLLPSGLQ